MNRHVALRFLIFAVVLAGPTVASALELDLGLEEPTEPKATLSVSDEKPPSGGTFDVVAEFKLHPKVKLYKETLRFEWTKLEGAKFAKLALPKSVTVPDPLAEKPGPTIDVFKGEVRIPARLVVTAEAGEKIVVEGKLHHQSCTDQICFPPAEEAFAFTLTAGQAVEGSAAPAVEPPDQRQPAATEPTNEEEGTPAGGEISVLLQIAIAFLWGIGIGFTPCVYPMIPVTAAVIGAKRDEGLMTALGASAVYVFGLSIVYALLGLLAASLGTVVGAVLHAWYVVVPVAALFVALAVVMLAGWDFAAPTGFAARLQRMLAGKKGLLTTFALGAVGGLVAGPCVLAPLLALLAKVFDSGDQWLGFWSLFAAAWGMGVPLIMFGTATGAMPKAGPWMEWIKKLLAFVLFWAAFYFLLPLIGDMAYKIGTALVLVVGAVFLGGFDQLTKDSVIGDRIKKVLGVAAVLCAVVLLVVPTPARTTLFTPGSKADIDKAIAQRKLVVLDFYADWCIDCKALDKKVFSKPLVIEAAENVVGIKINTDKHPDVAKRFGVKGPPTIVFIGRDGKVRKDLSFVGKKSLDEFVELLRKFKE